MVGASQSPDGPGQDGLAQHLDVPGERGEERAAIRPAQDRRQGDLVAARQLSPPAALPEPLGDLGEEAGEDDRIALFARGGVEQLAAPVEEVEAAHERMGGQEGAERAGQRRRRLQGALQLGDQIVLRLAQGHLDLVHGHGRHVPGLLAEQQLGRGLPVPQRDPAEDGDDRGRHRRWRGARAGTGAPGRRSGPLKWGAQKWPPIPPERSSRPGKPGTLLDSHRASASSRWIRASVSSYAPSPMWRKRAIPARSTRTAVGHARTP